MAYRTTQQDDGTHTIHDVEIFEECERKDGGAHLVFDADWIRVACECAQQMQDRGYMPVVRMFYGPIRIADSDFAGWLRDLRMIESDGKKATIIANICGIPPAVFAYIKECKLPYRIVAVNDYNRPAIDSMMLSVTDTPFFVFPPLLVEDTESNCAHE